MYVSDLMPSTSAASQASTAFVIFGNFQYLYFGVREEMRVDVSTDAGFDNITTVYRATERVAPTVAVAGAFARLLTASS